MDVEYLHSSMCGSYYIPCEILAWNVSNDTEKLGAIIKYYDDVSQKLETRWVDKSVLKLPKISEWIGM